MRSLVRFKESSDYHIEDTVFCEHFDPEDKMIIEVWVNETR